jgi:hypothetical protein
MQHKTFPSPWKNMVVSFSFVDTPPNGVDSRAGFTHTFWFLLQSGPLTIAFHTATSHGITALDPTVHVS